MSNYKPFWQTDRKPLIGFLALADRNRWPKAHSSKCSIFEAIEIVGAALFGPDWIGEELLALDWPMAPAVAKELHEQNLARQASLPSPIGSRPGIRLPGREGPSAHVSAYYLHRAKLATEESVKSEQARWERNRDLLQRLGKVVEWIATKCRDNELASYCRFQSGGRLMAIESHEWNVEYPVTRFLTKGTYNRWFTHVQPPKQWEVYVFFDRANLANVVAGLAHAPVRIATTNLDRLSPYLRLAVTLAMTKGYFSDDSDETQPIREAEVRAAWSEALPDVPWSETAAQAIAKVMGFPNPVAIQQGRRARASK